MIRNCKAPILVMATERDCLFPSAGVISRAEQIIENCTTYFLKDRGHLNYLSDKEKQIIVKFLIGEAE